MTAKLELLFFLYRQLRNLEFVATLTSANCSLVSLFLFYYRNFYSSERATLLLIAHYADYLHVDNKKDILRVRKHTRRMNTHTYAFLFIYLSASASARIQVCVCVRLSAYIRHVATWLIASQG